MSQVTPAETLPPVSSDRIISIDVLKGIAILLVILAHMAGFNFVPEEKWIFYLVYTFLDVFGPSMFVFLSCLGVVFSIKKKRGGLHDKKSRNAVFQRAAAIFVIGIIPNVVSNYKFGILSFWYWFILQLMAFCQIITYYALKIPKITRMILAFLIIFIITPDLFDNFTSNMYAAGIDYKMLGPAHLSNPYALAFWFLFYPPFMTPLLPWIAVPFIASIVGDSLVKAATSGTRETKINFIRSTLVDGLIFVLISIAFGGHLVTNDYGLGVLAGINTSPVVHLEGLPEFLVIHSSINLLYNLGMSMLILSLVFYIIEVRGIQGRVSNLLNFYGRFSLSLFFYHVIVGAFFPGMLTVPWLAIYVFSVYAFLYYFLKILIVRFEGIGTLEWVTSKFNRARNASKIFFETQIRGFKEGFQKISKKVKGFFLGEHGKEIPVENPVEAFIYDALVEHDTREDSNKKANGKHAE